MGLAAEAFQNAMGTARRIFSQLDAQWDPDNGLECPGYHAKENEAIRILAEEAKTMGAELYQDLAGNAYFYFSSQNPNAKAPIMIGSHVDGVPKGGRYDGRAGIVAGLAAIKHLQSNGTPLAHDVIISVFRAEESAWWEGGKACLGSRLATSLGITKEFLQSAKRKAGNGTLYSHMESLGIPMDKLCSALHASQTLFPFKKLAAYIETHVEQGPTLLNENKSLGIVSTIFGTFRPPSIVFTGRSGHSGSVPQKYRASALIPAMTFGLLWNLSLNVARGFSSNKLVHTISNVDVIDPSKTTIPGHVEVTLEARAATKKYINLSRRRTNRITRIVNALFRNVDVQMAEGNIETTDPVDMDSGLQDRIEAACEDLDISKKRMPSGAGHDAGFIAKLGVRTAMLFIRHGNQGDSHIIDEQLCLDGQDDPYDIEGDFCNAVRINAHILEHGLENQAETNKADNVVPFNREEFKQEMIESGVQELKLVA